MTMPFEWRFQFREQPKVTGGSVECAGAVVLVAKKPVTIRPKMRPFSSHRVAQSFQNFKRKILCRPFDLLERIHRARHLNNQKNNQKRGSDIFGTDLVHYILCRRVGSDFHRVINFTIHVRVSVLGWTL